MKCIYYIFIILLFGIDQQTASMQIQKNSCLKESHKNSQAFNQACMEGDISRAIVLLNSKSYKNIPVSSGKREGLLPIHLATYKGYVDLIDAMIGKIKNTHIQKALVNERVPFGTFNGCTALHLAAKKGHSLVAQLLIEKKADINAQITTGKRAGCTPLHIAAICNKPDIAILLCNKGALVEGDYGANASYTPLHSATWEGSIETVQVLLAAGANPNNVLLSGRYAGWPSHFLALKRKQPSFDYMKLLHMLFAAGANPDARIPKNQTILHIAQKKHCGSDATQFLLTHGVPTHIQDSLGNTALHYAAMRSLKSHIALLRWFTDVIIKNNEDKRPIDLLPENTPEEIPAIFKSEDNSASERARMKLIKCITQNHKNIVSKYLASQYSP